MNNFDLRSQFADLLRDIRIPVSDDIKSKIEKYCRLNAFVHDNKPKSLFRYRNTEQYTIDAFRNGIVSVTKPCKMGDIFDSRIGVDKEQVKKVIEEFCNTNYMNGAFDYVSNGGEIPEQALNQFSRGIRRSIGKNKHRINKGNLKLKDKTQQLVPEVKEILTKKVEEERVAYIDSLRNTGYIACFSEKHTDIDMWDRYADKHTGYVLEYDFETLNERFRTLDSNGKLFQPQSVVFPVIYGEKYDSTDIVLHSLLNELVQSVSKTEYLKHPDELWHIKGYLYKHKKYEQEAEWRLITPIKGVKSSAAPYFDVGGTPKAIYYGVEITDENFQALDAIALKKSIKRYRMVANPLDMSVEAVLLDD